MRLVRAGPWWAVELLRGVSSPLGGSSLRSSSAALWWVAKEGNAAVAMPFSVFILHQFIDTYMGHIA